ncbi:MAG: Alpha-D-kanosaminyltransferase [Lentisphaerae bacterium ADurb.Bin082]|nr:MAG: Alpha-D-kanosaminyltransferase [Lentisphaerae bacterium ADurb.Bin082]
MGEDVAGVSQNDITKLGPTRLLIVKTAFGLGGIERSLIEFLRHLDYSRYDVDLLLLYGPFDLIPELPEQVHLLNVGEYGIRLRLSPLYVFYYILSVLLKSLRIKGGYQRYRRQKMDVYYRSIYRYFCKDKAYDVAIAYQQGFACEYVARFAKAKRKIMMYHHGSVEDVDYLTPWFKEADVLLTVSKDVAEKLKVAFPFAQYHVEVIPNLLDAYFIKKQADEYAPELKQGVLTLCTCGRISPEKGFDLAIGAARILKEQGLAFHWYFVGDGYDKVYVESIRQRISQDGLDVCITITGFLTNPYPYLKNCDIVVIPSRFEANPMIIQEAKILAKPIVATKTTGALDALIDGETGILCEIAEESMVEGIIHLYRNPNHMDEISANLASLNMSLLREEFYRKWDKVLNS